jgi:hypothetical protein
VWCQRSALPDNLAPLQRRSSCSHFYDEGDTIKGADSIKYSVASNLGQVTSWFLLCYQSALVSLPHPFAGCVSANYVERGHLILKLLYGGGSTRHGAGLARQRGGKLACSISMNKRHLCPDRESHIYSQTLTSHASSEGARMKHYSWSEVYRIALLELDSSKIPDRIALARKTLTARMHEIPVCASGEQQAIQHALNALQTMEMSEIGRKAQPM